MEDFMKRLSLSLLVVLVLTLAVATPVFAGGGHIYGVVFMDDNQDGAWNIEAGVADVPVHFVQGDPATGSVTEIVLYSAWTDNDGEIGPDQYCTHLQDENFGDPITHWELPKGCNGTFGLTPAVGTWKVWIEVPAGYDLTTPGSKANPYMATSLGIGDPGWLEFGLQKAGAGGQMPDYAGNQMLVNVPVVEDRYVAETVSAASFAVPGVSISLAGPFTVKVMPIPQ